MGNAILYRMASGIPGDVSRRQSSTVEQVILNASAPFSAYGLFGKLVSGLFVPLTGGEIASALYGLIVRPYPTQTINANGSGVSIGAVGDVMRRGYMTVALNAGTAAMGGKVYTRVATPTTPKPLGGIEAVSDVAISAVAGANTGNGTFGTASATDAAVAGAYAVKMLTATTYSVLKPDGVRLADGATGIAYTAAGVTFTITAGGTAFVAGDTFTVTVAPNTILVPGATFEAAADASGNVEISYNI